LVVVVENANSICGGCPTAAATIGEGDTTPLLQLLMAGTKDRDRAARVVFLVSV
jgi:hypothetical protein